MNFIYILLFYKN